MEKRGIKVIFKEIAPFIISLTLIVSALIVMKIKRSKISGVDSIFAILGALLGLLITLVNLLYSNNYLITIGPILTIECFLYLKYRNKLLSKNVDIDFGFNSRTLKIIQAIYWICISIALISYYQAEPYHRPLILFVSISIAASSLGLEIISHNYQRNSQVYYLFSKIIILSLVLRFTAYFVSPYQVGSDPWGHADLVKEIYMYGITYLPDTHPYYSNYPLMHVYASIVSFLCNMDTKRALSIVGVVLTVSTIFVYLFVKKITNDSRLALFSMLLLNFSDFHIQWSIQVIAMTFGIALYTIAIYFLIEKQKKTNTLYKIFTVLFIYVIIWTHTVSSFIFIVSLIALYVGSYIHERIYMDKYNYIRPTVNNSLCLLALVLLIFHWMDPKYFFLERILNGLMDSLLNEAEFLGRETISNIEDSWLSIIDITGFLILIFLGVIGSLYSLSNEYQTKAKVSLIFMIVLLLSIFFIFPVLGIRNILPYRWPAFIYITLILFSGIGVFAIFNCIKNKFGKVSFIFILLIIFSFFMSTNSITNIDSPIYGKNLNQKTIWAESEIKMLTNINNLYEDTIITDTQTHENIFLTYLKRNRVADYLITSNGSLDWEYMGDKLIIWRKVSIERPVQVHGFGDPKMILGSAFKQYLDRNYHDVYDCGNGEVYLGINRSL